MVNRKFKTISLLFFLTILLGLSIFSFSVSAQVPKTSGSAPMQNIVIDGVINEAEWADRDWKIEFHLDIDDAFNPPDKDGANYMYLGEDHTNFYVGLDLISDQTGDPTGEWLGIWMNVNNRSFNTLTTWASYLDNGTESVLHDVENDRPLPFFRNQVYGLSYGYEFNSDGEINTVHGTSQGNYTHLEDLGPASFNVTSTSVVGDNLTQVDFSVDIKEWFLLFPEINADAVHEMRLLIKSRSNITIDDHDLVFWYNDGTMNSNDPQQTKSINTGTGWLQESFDYGVANLSSDYIMKFSIIGENSAPFETYFEYIEFGLNTNYTNTFGGAMLSAYSSISNYDIQWSFGTSENNMSDHRMFEIRIPKTELEHYNSSEEIGIMVAGYGTMTFPNEVFWVFGVFNNSIRHQQHANYKYYNMFGIDAPPTPQNPAVPGYLLPIVIALATISTFSLIKKQKNKLKQFKVKY
ncbi:hypothetical protein LCGC14_1304150 [marine sediment metagenome]|uniref:Uncharacterized protein n=1 Tax=marine sediment metagenome TaxID=412755 RepID=A0A0F9KPZ1_9ZZZZ